MSGDIHVKWSSHPMAHPRSGHVLVALEDGRALAVGGLGADDVAPPELFDPGTGRWTTAEKTCRERGCGHTAIRLNDGRVLVAGGSRKLDEVGEYCGAFEATAEVWNPLTGVWSRCGKLRMPRAGHAAVLLADGRVLLAGGCVGVHIDLPPDKKATASCELWDPVRQDLKPAPAMSVTRDNLVALALRDGSVLAVGRNTFDGSRRRVTADRWSPSDKSWREVASPRVRPSAIIVAGVALEEGGALVVLDQQIFLWDAQRDSWSAGPAVSWETPHGSATRLGDGRVLLLGCRSRNWYPGETPDTPKRTAVVGLVDPTTGQLEAWAGAKEAPPPDHRACLLADGRVLVCGGVQRFDLYPTSGVDRYGSAMAAIVELPPPLSAEKAKQPRARAAAPQPPEPSPQEQARQGARDLEEVGDDGEVPCDWPEVRLWRFLASPAARKRGQLKVIHTDLGDEGAERIATNPNLSGLSVLVLEGVGLGSKGLQALGSSTHLAGLKELRIVYNREIGIKGLQGFAGGLTLKALEALELNQCDLTADAAKSLASCEVLSSLRSLSLTLNELGDKGARALAASPHLRGLKELDLSHCKIGKAGLKALVKATFLDGLRALDLSGNFEAETGWAALLGSGRLSSLEELRVALTPFPGLDRHAVLDAFSRDGVPRLAELHWDGGRSVFTRDGTFEAFTRWPALEHVKWLSLRNGSLGDAGGLLLLSSPYLQNLEYLEVTQCEMKDVTEQDFRRALPKLETLVYQDQFDDRDN